MTRTIETDSDWYYPSRYYPTSAHYKQHQLALRADIAVNDLNVGDLFTVEITPFKCDTIWLCHQPSRTACICFYEGDGVWKVIVNDMSLDPTSKKFDIWSEGYVCTGQSSKAVLHGSVYADTFKEAVAIHVNGLSAEPRSYFNLEAGTHWGCRLYDNEKDARKSFG